MRSRKGIPRRDPGSVAPIVAGLASVLVIAAVIVVALAQFTGRFAPTIPVTVVTQRAGLVMNTDARVKMNDIQVGTVSSIESRADGTAVLHLAMNPARLDVIPENVGVDITSSTVFGAKFVELTPPAIPSARPMHRGQELRGERVTVEINTVFERLTQVLDRIDPAKLNEALSALAKSVDGRGAAFGQTLTQLNSFLGKIEPSLPALEHSLATLPSVAGVYADSAPDLVRIVDDGSAISRTITDERENLDTVLVSIIGLADLGTDVIATNGEPLTNLLHLLVPTTGLLDQYHEQLNCGIEGLLPFSKVPAFQEPGVLVSTGFALGIDHYRYPGDLPKVNATGGPNCKQVGLPTLAPGQIPPFVLTDTGANPFRNGNNGIVLNSDGLKQLLFGPLEGPPRNTTQIGMPG